VKYWITSTRLEELSLQRKVLRSVAPDVLLLDLSGRHGKPVKQVR
jgi:hypothetical protein